MVTASMTLAEYKAEQAEKNMSVGEKLSRLNGRSEHLNVHRWTDEQLLALPEELVKLTFEQSATLQEEFRSLSALVAYRRAVGNGQARIAVRR